MKKCTFCGQDVDDAVGIGRRDECPGCGGDLHCCLQCIFYDPTYADECREPQAEPVYEKDRSNFCDYFQLGRDIEGRGAVRSHVKDELEKLFKK